MVPLSKIRRERIVGDKLGAQTGAIDMEVQVPTTLGEEPLPPDAAPLILPYQDIFRSANASRIMG